jgi:hypothetical protein
MLWYAVLRHNDGGDFPIDAVRVGDLEDLPLGTLDADLLKWAEREGRIVVSIDRSTMPDHFRAHLAHGSHCPGLFLIRSIATVQRVVEFLYIAAYASEDADWHDTIEYLA